MTIPNDTLTRARYVNLETFRKDGRGVKTPVWIAEREGRLYAFSQANAGKVKRIRGQGRVRMATCRPWGTVTGEWVEGSATVLTRGDHTARARDLLRKKYGLLGWIAFTLGAAKDRAGQRAYLEITLD